MFASAPEGHPPRLTPCFASGLKPSPRSALRRRAQRARPTSNTALSLRLTEAEAAGKKSGMVTIPKRITLVTQVAEVLRSGIMAREWVERLPAEAALAAQLQVSRMTLRSGMKILIREGLLQISKGRRASIRADRKSAGYPRRGRVVGIIFPAPVPPFATAPTGIYYNSYCDILHKAGIQTRFFSGLRFYQKDPAKPLEDLLHEAKADFWVLTMSTEPLQRWFARRQIPVMVDGSCQSGVALPALDVDYRSVCRHAVGSLLGLGHTRIAFFSVESRAGGDVASVEGFEEGFRTFPEFGGRPAIAYSEDSVDGIRTSLARLFRAENPPTALLCGRVGVTLMALTFLINRGLRLPRDVSLISRDSIPELAFVVPAVARYAIKPESYARRLARMTLNHFEGTLPARQHFILPVFTRGDSIGPCPKKG